jgi:CBS domain containing-hemolysin-like protein
LATEVNRYAAVTAALIGAMVVALFVVLFSSGGIQIVGLVVLLFLVVGLGGVIGAQVAKQRKERLEH